MIQKCEFTFLTFQDAKRVLLSTKRAFFFLVRYICCGITEPTNCGIRKVLLVASWASYENMNLFNKIKTTSWAKIRELIYL